jgi:creatinine amidohydrolase
MLASARIARRLAKHASACSAHEMAAHYRPLSPTGADRLAWQAQDLHPCGACGDATNADAERGRRVIEHAAQAL